VITPMSKPIIVKVKEIKEAPSNYLGKELVLEGELNYLGSSPKEENFSINMPSDREYEVCTIKDDTGVILALALPELEIERYENKKVRVKGIIKKTNHNHYMFKIIEILESS